MQMSQNAISNGLKLKNIPGIECFIFPAFHKYWILKLHSSTQDPFSPSVLNAFRCPWSAKLLQGFNLHTNVISIVGLQVHKLIQ